MATQAKPLTVRRAADREQMAETLDAALTAAGATVRNDNEFAGPRELRLSISLPCGARCTVRFDGRGAMPDTYVVTWNTERRMAPRDGWSVNEFHGCKATRIFHNFGHLVGGLTLDVAAFLDGSAYADGAR